jgi:hypothetical protein
VKRWLLLPVALLALLVACGGATAPPVQAGNPTPVKVITDWSGDEQGWRVVEVTVKGGQTRVCIERLVKYGGGFSEDPKGKTVGIDCEPLPR